MDGLDGVVPRRHDEAGHPRAPGQLAGTAELVGRHLHAGELLDHHRPVDERVAAGRHDDEVGDPEQQRRTGHRRTVDDDDRRHDPRAVDERPGEATPTLEGGDALDDVGAGRGEDDHEGHALLACGAGGRLDDRRRGRRQRYAAEAGRRSTAQLDPHDPAIVDRRDARRRQRRRRPAGSRATPWSSVCLIAAASERAPASERPSRPAWPGSAVTCGAVATASAP